MELTHTFSVPVPPADAWAVLTDLGRIAPCMPGATLESAEGETFKGSVKVKVGPMQLTYRGDARFAERDDAALAATIEASGRETRGPGTAKASIRASLTDGGTGTIVKVSTTLAVSGKPAQFGRGVMEDVGNKLLGQFADCLAKQLDEGAARGAGDASVTPTQEGGDAFKTASTNGDGTHGAPMARPSAPPSSVNDAPVNLLATAGIPLLRRLAPALAALAVLWLLRRRRRQSRAPVATAMVSTPEQP